MMQKNFPVPLGFEVCWTRTRMCSRLTSDPKQKLNEADHIGQLIITIMV